MGTSVFFQCASCGFDSGQLGVGIGMLGIEVVAVSCATCRTIVTSIVDPESVANDDEFGSTYPYGDPIENPCDVCGGELILLRSGAEQRLGAPARPAAAQDCPECGDRTLRTRPGFLLWD